MICWIGCSDSFGDGTGGRDGGGGLGGSVS